MNQTPVETVEEYEAAMLKQQAAATGREPVLFKDDDGEDDGFDVVDKEH